MSAKNAFADSAFADSAFADSAFADSAFADSGISHCSGGNAVGFRSHYRPSMIKAQQRSDTAHAGWLTGKGATMVAADRRSAITQCRENTSAVDWSVDWPPGNS